MTSSQRSPSERPGQAPPKQARPQAAKPAAETAAPGAHPGRLAKANLPRTLSDPTTASPAAIRALQRTIGNRAVQRLVGDTPGSALRRDYSEEGEEVAQRQSDPGMLGGGPLDAQTDSAIQSVRGRGQRLPDGVRGPMEQALGANFQGVRVHADATADRLNRSVSAKAFTVGSDIFFSQGAYGPKSAGGRELLAHELTHVVQQGGGKANRVQTKLSVGPADDRYEREADRLAGQVAHMPAVSGPSLVRRQFKSVAAPAIRPSPIGRIQRKMKFTPQDFKGELTFGAKLQGRLGLETGFAKIQRILGDYWNARESFVELQLLVVLKGLASDWAQRHARDKSRSGRVKGGAIAQLAAAADEEIPKASRQAVYMTDVQAGSQKFDYLSFVGRQIVPDQAVGLARGQTGRNLGEKQEAVDIVQKYHLTDAEIAAIKIYTVDDYKYINPAMMGNDSWLKSQIPDIKDSTSQDTSDEGVAKAKAEGLRHGKEAKKGLKKLPDFTGNLYRGMTLYPQVLKDKYRPGQQLNYPNFTSSTRARNVSTEFITKQLKKDKERGENKVGALLTLKVTHKGKDVRWLSLVPMEEEVLLLPGTHFLVTEVQPGDGYTEVSARQLPMLPKPPDKE